MRPAASAAASRPNPSPASVRVVPMCERVHQAVMRQFADGARPEDLVFPGPGGSNGIPRETTPAMLARVTLALDERIGLAMTVVGSPLRDAEGPAGAQAG
jgi:hypothetical protein